MAEEQPTQRLMMIVVVENATDNVVASLKAQVRNLLRDVEGAAVEVRTSEGLRGVGGPPMPPA